MLYPTSFSILTPLLSFTCCSPLARYVPLQNLDHAEQKIALGACDRAAKLSQAQIREFKPRADVVADLKDLFGEEVLELKMTSIADSMHALSCHNMTLPCSDKVCELLVLMGRAKSIFWC